MDQIEQIVSYFDEDDYGQYAGYPYQYYLIKDGYIAYYKGTVITTIGLADNVQEGYRQVLACGTEYGTRMTDRATFIKNFSLYRTEKIL